ncbi:MAG: hypothetical protein WBK20_07340 [Spirochaetota bacterium]
MEINEYYSEYYLAYLDILGIKRKISNSRQDVDIEAIIEALSINSLIPNNGLKETSEIGNIKFYSWFFSDTIVLMVEKNINALPHLFLVIRFIHDKFAKSGLLLRGSVVVGQMYNGIEQNTNQHISHNKNINRILLGPAIIEAYQLENEIAIYPRILVSKKLYNEIKENNFKIYNYPISDNKKLLDLIKKDKDGLYYFDILSKDIIRKKDEKLINNNEKFFIILPNDSERDDSIYSSLNDIIERHQNYRDIKILQKINWLKNYLDNIE